MQDKTNNVNVKKKGNINVNVNNVTAIATKLAEQLGDNESYKFFCKVAWSLPEHEIWSALEYALTGKNPARLFTWVTKRKLAGEL